MSIVVTPDSFDVGAMCTATLRWEGGPPNPNDAHIEAQHDDGSWHVVIDMPTIPDNQNPANGFDIRFSSGNPNVGGPGERHFRVRWTWDGKDRDMTERPVYLGAVINEKSEKEDKSNIEKRLAALEEKFNLAHLQGGLVTHPVIRFPFGAEMLSAYSIIGPIVYPPIIYEVFTSLLPTLKSGVKEVVIDAGPGGPSIFGFSITGFTTLPETNPFTNQPNNPAKITVKFLDGSSQEHTVQPGSKWKLTNGDFVLFN